MSPSAIPAPCLEQIIEACVAMAGEADYHPGAPSDGFGHVTVDRDALDPGGAHGLTYAERWWQQEDACSFLIGCCNFPTRKATIYAVEAARAMCGANDALALDLLRMAVAELERNGA